MALTNVNSSLQDYLNSSDRDKIIVNDIPYIDNISDDELFHNLMTVYDSDVVSTIPQCDCGEIKGRCYVGCTCGHCGTEVKEVNEAMDSHVWLRAIDAEGYGKIPFISPNFWSMFSKTLYSSTKKIDYLRWLCDETYNLPSGATSSSTHKPVEDALNKAMGGKRGYLNFLENIDNVFKTLMEHPAFRKREGPTAAVGIHLEELYKMYRKDVETNGGHGIFSNYLPIISKQIFVMENNDKGKYVILKTAINIDVVKSWLRLCYVMKEKEDLGEKPLPADRIGRETAKVISSLACLYSEYYNDYLYKKSGLYRKHIFGAKTTSFRGVIVSRQGPHDRRGIEIPWSLAITAYKPQIRNKLLRRKFSLREIDRMIYRYTNKYDKFMHEILLEITNEAPDSKVPVIVHRNPTLGRSSSILCYVDKIKTAPNDKTIGFSQLIAKGPNADYDGDVLNYYFIFDKKLHELFEPFDCKYIVAFPKEPFKISKYLTFLSPGNQIMSNYLGDKSEDPENDTIVKSLVFEDA